MSLELTLEQYYGYLGPSSILRGRVEIHGLYPRAEIQKEVWLHMCLEHHALELGVSGIKKVKLGVI